MVRLLWSQEVDDGLYTDGHQGDEDQRTGGTRSVSLLQFVLGVLTKAEVVSAPLHQYVPVVTSELSDIYPEVNRFEDNFDFELTGTP